MDRQPAARWAPSTVALLTVAWAPRCAGAARWVLAIGFEHWAEQASNQGAGADELARKAYTALLLLVVEVVAAPVVIAVVAVCGLLRRTAAVYLAIVLGLGVLAIPVAAGAHRGLNPPPPPPSVPTTCQELSGGDTRCPGG
ncbi:hypothetical protein HCB18_27000 [Salinispora arenicola]|uniref:hypothetical protein n=1 Tax=Salinispora arenicola TaxID=168697 RepID=UPI0016AC19A6|nr:hypothetical protein [Salinispora arenicola]NIL60014.1 hypothetical protein [Salinispora arenicola]